MSLRFSIANPTTAPDAGAALRFSRYDTSGNINTALGYDASADPLGDTAKGYYIHSHPGSSAASNTSLTKNLRHQAVTGIGTGAVNSSNNGSALGLGPAFTHTSTFGATLQTVTMTFTKTTAGVSIVTGLGSDSFTYNDNSSPYKTFDRSSSPRETRP